MDTEKSPEAQDARTPRNNQGTKVVSILTAAVIVLLVGVATGAIYLYPWAIVGVLGYALWLDEWSVSDTTLAPSRSAAAMMTAVFLTAAGVIWYWPMDTAFHRWTLGGVALVGATALLAIDRYWPEQGVQADA